MAAVAGPVRVGDPLAMRCLLRHSAQNQYAVSCMELAGLESPASLRSAAALLKEAVRDIDSLCVHQRVLNRLSRNYEHVHAAYRWQQRAGVALAQVRPSSGINVLPAGGESNARRGRHAVEYRGQCRAHL
jgi:hypothetical protein